MPENPLLLLHGALGSAAQLEPLQKQLAQHFTVQTLNFSGHGGKSFAGDFSIAAFADEVLTFLNENEIDQVNIFGYSMGGYVALHLAKHDPQRIGKIFTLGTKFDWNPATAEHEVKMLNPSKIQEKVPLFAEALAKRHQPNDWKELVTKTASMLHDLGHGAALEAQDFTNIQHPVTIGIGSQDNMVSLEESEATANLLPNGRLLLFSEFKHPIEQANFTTLADAIELFIKSE